MVHSHLQQQQQQLQQEEATLHSCLCLLDVTHAEGARGVDLGRGMFRKPNARALELILYHTYTVVKGKAAAKRHLKGLWPLADKDRKQAKDFYQRMQDWLKEAGQLAEHGQSLAAFQRNPSGSKLVSFLCDLTDWALVTQHERMFPDAPLQQHGGEDPRLLASLAEPLLTAAKAHNQLQAERLLQLCWEGAQLQQQAEAAAAQLKEQFYTLTAQLHEAQTAAEALGLPDVQQHSQTAPSIKLPSILPDTDASSSSSGSAAAATAAATAALPGALQQQQAEVAELWQRLDAHLAEFDTLRQLLDGLSGSNVHPHAIDAAALRAHGQLAAAPTAAAAATGLDVVALVEAWLLDVGSICRYVKTLAGQCADTRTAQANQARGWLPVKAGAGAGGGAGVGRCSAFITPLVATSDAASHATHLFAQLQLHRGTRDSLLALRTQLGSQVDDTAARVDQLRGALLPILEEQYRAAEQAAADEAAQEDAQQQLQQQHWGSAGGAGGLFASSSGMQLVPPTPLLQQQAAGRRRKQEQQDADEQQLQAAGSAADVSIDQAQQQQRQPEAPCLYPRIGPAAPILPAGAGGTQLAAPRLPAEAPGTAVGAGREAPPLVPEPAASSPDMPSSPHGSSSSASSAALPAAELLMSQELMDLDLIGEDEDDGGVFAACRGSALRRPPGAGGQNAGRISFARFSLSTTALAPALAAAHAGDGRPGAVSGHPSSSSSDALTLMPPRRQQQQQPLRASSGGDGGDDGSPEDAGIRAHPANGDATPTLAWPAQDAGAAAAQASAAAGADGGDCEEEASPLEVTTGDVLLPHHGVAPGSGPLSSAKPRRLTFAAAAAAADDDSPPAPALSVLGGSRASGGCETVDSPSFLASNGGSSTSSDAGQDDDAAAPAGGGGDEGHHAGAATAMALLRQRFQMQSKQQ